MEKKQVRKKKEVYTRPLRMAFLVSEPWKQASNRSKRNLR